MSGQGTGRQEFRRGWPVVLASMLGIGLGLSPVPFYTIGMLAPELAHAFHWTIAQIQLGLLLMTVTVILASPLVGLLADRLGVRTVALASVVLFALAFMAFALSDGSLARFYATWIAAGLLGSGTLPVTWTRAVNNRFQIRKGLALGLCLVGTGVFGSLVKPYTAAIIAHFGWRAAYVAIGALPLLIAFPVALFGFHDVGGRAGRGRARAAARRAEIDRLSAATPGLTLRQAVADWRFWVLAVAFVPVSFAVGGPIPNLETILRLQGFAPHQIVSLSEIVGLSVVVGRLGGGWLMDRLWAPGVACVLLSAPALACFLLGRASLSYGAAAASIFMIGFAAGLEYDAMAYLTARYFGMKSYGAIYGALYGFFAVGAGVAPAIFGRAFDLTHSYSGVLAAAGIALVCGALMLLLLGRYRRFGDPGVTEAVMLAEQTADATPA